MREKMRIVFTTYMRITTTEYIYLFILKDADNCLQGKYKEEKRTFLMALATLPYPTKKAFRQFQNRLETKGYMKINAF